MQKKQFKGNGNKGFEGCPALFVMYLCMYLYNMFTVYHSYQ